MQSIEIQPQLFQTSISYHLSMGDPVQPARIMIVTHRAKMAQAIALPLELCGYYIIVVDDTHTAMSIITKQAPALIILDEGSGRVDASKLCTLVKSNPITWHIPVVVVATDVKAWAVSASIKGADDYLERPFDPRELAICVRILLRKCYQIEQPEQVENVIVALMRAIEAKDNYTNGHLQRLATYASALGERLGLSEAELTIIRYGALLHDVGKIGVEECILQKDGALTDEEYRAIQQHTIIGERIVQPLHFAMAVAPIVRHHHERWDGQGYPDGLAGTAIPFGARVVAVVDAFDAMTTQRTYNHPMSFADALAQLQIGARSAWDPDIVEAFVAWFQSEYCRDLEEAQLLVAREVGG